MLFRGPLPMSPVGLNWENAMRLERFFRLQCRAMPLYRIYRMKDSPRQQFRWAPHVSGCATVKPKDYEQRDQVEAAHEYDAWRILRESGEALEVGDLLETVDGRLSICKYVGF